MAKMIDPAYADDTIAAISTPVGEGGIGIVRLSGPRAVRIADKIFVAKSGKALGASASHTIHYGRIRHGKAPFIDEALVSVMRAPKTYTREDVVEINCHGGIQAAGKVLEACEKNGCRLAEPGEFTKRAFLNGRIDLVQAEAVLDVIRAKTESALNAAAAQLEGALSDRVNILRARAMDIAARVEASIDFPEEETGAEARRLEGELDGVIGALKQLIDTSHEGMIIREGVLAVICGKPNAGKSSLMNLLLKRDRVIVTPIPGTTRDAVEETINLKGVPVRLVDTAGIGLTEDIVEKEGIRRSKDYLEKAGLALLVLDGSTNLDGRDRHIIKLLENKKKLVIINKTDLPRKIDKDGLKALSRDDRVVEISVVKRKNIGVLEKAFIELIWEGCEHHGHGVVMANARHRGLLERARRSLASARRSMARGDWPELASVDLREAVFSLGMIIGESVSYDILDRIFERFCVGK